MKLLQIVNSLPDFYWKQKITVNILACTKQTLTNWPLHINEVWKSLLKGENALDL